jgi:hypothetical protein
MFAPPVLPVDLESLAACVSLPQPLLVAGHEG